MVSLADLKHHAPKILLIGDAGTGKTALALTGGARVVIIDCDNGTRTGLTLKDKFFEERQKVEVKPCWEDKPNQATAFQKALAYIEGLCNKGDNLEYDIV